MAFLFGAFMKRYRGLFLYSLVLFIITLALYGQVIPPAISSKDNVLVYVGLAVAIGWPFVLIYILYEKYKKVSKCVKF